ncbi:ABC transporter substrate-binding protein [Natronincola ferrireducens]|uniref:Iron complex transport system substrate-binding protein n=1 Tax=Natronincola ferrireducens TaxID=393762 RepID=A0A1G9E0V9_9FIRM|nr:ABC transporter substrate-binding protein [Natronincola ferrireducens]SDK69775.1 iron complex transport system substrate-binding protein [Natronincola ferrireducens]
MKQKKIVWIAWMLLIAFMVVGCTVEAPINEGEAVEDEEQGEGFPREVVDGLGYTVTINQKPERIISASPSQTETLFILGLADNIIAVSDYCDYPQEALDKEKIGGYKNLNTEKIIELSPDILFIYGDGDEEAIKLIEAAGITIARFEPETIDEVFSAITITGEMMGTEEKAETVVAELTAKRDSIVEKVKEQETVSAFYEIWHEPLMAAGTGSFMDELITLAGGENVAKDAEGAYPIFSEEALVERNPEVYLIPASHYIEFFDMTEEDKAERIAEITSRPGYGEIDAVKNNRIELLEPNVVSRPGVRIVEALEMIAKALHPQLF